MEEAGIAAVRTEAWGWIQESCILKKWCHICAAEANFSARTGYIQGHDCLFADKKKTVPLRDIVFPEKMSGKEPRHTAADNQHIRAHIPPEPRKGRAQSLAAVPRAKPKRQPKMLFFRNILQARCGNIFFMLYCVLQDYTKKMRGRGEAYRRKRNGNPGKNAYAHPAGKSAVRCIKGEKKIALKMEEYDMKKKLSVLCAVLLCLLLAAGCTNKAEEDAGLAALQKIIRGSGGTVGIAFLGYTDSEGTEETLKSLVKESTCVRSYPFLSETGVVAYEGAEVFALVPGGNDCRITVCKAGITEEGTYIDWTDEVIYEGRPGEAVILRCNLSEICANVLVMAEGSGGTLQFHPRLSMENGHVEAQPGCFDFSVYDESGAADPPQ